MYMYMYTYIHIYIHTHTPPCRGVIAPPPPSPLESWSAVNRVAGHLTALLADLLEVWFAVMLAAKEK